jgi:hypothetical protein
VVGQEVVRSLCANHRYWHCCARRVSPDTEAHLNVFLGTTDSAEGDTSRAPFMEEEDPR